MFFLSLSLSSHHSSVSFSHRPPLPIAGDSRRHLRYRSPPPLFPPFLSSFPTPPDAFSLCVCIFPDLSLLGYKNSQKSEPSSYFNRYKDEDEREREREREREIFFLGE
ncbi:unnamed protein product [Camellia sinensis]